MKRSHFLFLALITALISVDAYSQAGSQPLAQFLFPAFTKGVVKMKSGDSYSAMFNYNMVEEEMIFINKASSYLALENIGSVDTIIIAGRRFIPVQKVFYEVLYNGQYPVFIQHKSKYSQEGTATAYGLTSQTNARETYVNVKAGNQIRSLDMPDNVKVVPEDVYWIRVKDELKRFINERQFIKLFPEKEDELKSFIRKTPVDFSKRDDLVKLAVHVNEISK